MPAMYDYFGSVTDVWVIWFLSAVILMCIARAALVRVRRWSPRALVCDENGASYAVSVVMVLPVFTFLICIIIESTLMLVVKMGTLYAAYSAARSAIVWSAAEPPQPDMPRKAAVQALAPFASSNKDHLAAFGPAALAGLEDALAYYGVYKAYTSGQATPQYVMSKYQFANLATSINVSPTDRQDGGVDMVATVEYQMPLHVPGIGPLLGSRGSGALFSFFTRKISSTVILEEELPQSGNQKLGISYDSSKL